MALRQILEFPDLRLRKVAKPVADVDDTIRKLIDDMFETMYEAQGIGLAANTNRCAFARGSHRPTE